MKKKKYLFRLGAVLFASVLIFPYKSQAEINQGGNGTIRFDGEYKQEIRDPEHPTKIVDPGKSPVTKGDLRIDFVPQLDFGSNKISDQDELYPGNAQLFLDETEARGNFIQLSDYRGTGSGWLLQVRQETQLKNPTISDKELNGAVISFDQSWVNSTRDMKQAPIVSKEIVQINNIGETYNLAQAKTGTGEGTWSIIFGASIDNDNEKKHTLSERLDRTGERISNPQFNNKTVYQNSAVTLSIPGATKKEPVNYQTVITWILSELP